MTSLMAKCHLPDTFVRSSSTLRYLHGHEVVVLHILRISKDDYIYLVISCVVSLVPLRLRRRVEALTKWRSPPPKKFRRSKLEWQLGSGWIRLGWQAGAYRADPAVTSNRESRT